MGNSAETTTRDWNERHLSEEELTGILYETAAYNGHADACLHCKGRLAAMEQRRGAVAGAERAEISEFALARQRARIYSRMDGRPASRLGSRKLWLWAGAPVAAVAALMLTISLRTMAPEPVADNGSAIVEDTLYSDIYRTVSQETPTGVYAMAGLFEPVSAETGAR